LNAFVFKAEHSAKGIDEPGFSEAGIADKKRVPARQKRYKCLIYNVMLAKYDAPDVFFYGGHALAPGLYFGDESGRRVARGSCGLCGGFNIGHDDPLE
jgi:hypothetical protein